MNWRGSLSRHSSHLKRKQCDRQMTTLRQMRREDLREVNLLLSKAFTHARIQQGYREGRVPLCRKEFLELYFRANSPGCFVIEKNYRVISFCFTRLWGTVSWLGPLGVDPSEEGQGFGKEIVRAAVGSLKTSGAKTIGLELAANSARNLAFYTKLGFEEQGLVIDVIKKISEERKPLKSTEIKTLMYSEIPPKKRTSLLEEARKFWQQTEPGLDYTGELELLTDFKFGDACFIMKPDRMIGFILAHTQTYSQEEERRFIKLNALQMSSQMTIETLSVFIRIVENWALSEKLSAIYLRMPTQQNNVLAYLLSREFKVLHNELRMTLTGYSQRADSTSINFSKWE